MQDHASNTLHHILRYATKDVRFEQSHLIARRVPLNLDMPREYGIERSSLTKNLQTQPLLMQATPIITKCEVQQKT